MKLNPPKQITFWICVVVGLLGIVGELVPSLPLLGPFAFWLVVIAFALLVFSVTTTGL
jgi:hypothetical protein